MPRTGRGGKRSGTPGASYTNRSDLNQNRTLPVSTVPNQPYGQAGQQQAMQQAVPMAAGPIGQPQSAAPPSVPPPPQPGPATAAAPMPGELTPLHAPTAMPSQPVTQGVASGSGAGPDVLQQGLPMGSASQMLTHIAQAAQSPELSVLARYAQSIGQ